MDRWMDGWIDGVIYAVPTSRVIFTTKTSLDLFSLGQKQGWAYSVWGVGRWMNGWMGRWI